MKKLIIMSLALIMSMAMFADDYTLYIAAEATTNHKLSTIQKLTFENGNVVVNLKDGTKESTAISTVSRMFFRLTPVISADVNEDGIVDTQDILKVYDFIQTATETKVGEIEDVNDDGTVDTQDVLVIYDYIMNN